ncbi:hypothetical protein ACHQM5_021916 [Ranunculus cassubicifolius]
MESTLVLPRACFKPSIPLRHNTFRVEKLKPFTMRILRMAKKFDDQDCLKVKNKEKFVRKEENELVEELEELEEEAIMGRDEGREPVDYNRRAHMFDTCSKVFQGLKLEEKEISATTKSIPFDY